jgi:hypothetical protein
MPDDVELRQTVVVVAIDRLAPVTARGAVVGGAGEFDA